MLCTVILAYLLRIFMCCQCDSNEKLEVHKSVFIMLERKQISSDPDRHKISQFSIQQILMSYCYVLFFFFNIPSRMPKAVEPCWCRIKRTAMY